MLSGILFLYEVCNYIFYVEVLCRYLIFAVLLSEIFLVNSQRGAFDEQLYEDVLDPEQCSRQLNYLSISRLGLQFLDASAKVPSGILTGNTNDFGDYFQCLSINSQVQDMDIHGKYCTVLLPIEQVNLIQLPDLGPILNGSDWWPPNFNDTDWWPNITDPWFPENEGSLVEKFDTLQHYYTQIAGFGVPVNSRVFPFMVTALGASLVAMCIPKVCTVEESMNFLQRRLLFLNITYEPYYCRLPNDKPFAPADYTAMVIFSFIGLLVILCTTYDLYLTFVVKVDPKKVNPLHVSFSVYTNTRRFLTFRSSPESVQCLDGIRAISMLWIVIGHTYCMTLLGFVHNLRHTINWMSMFSSFWITSAPIVVDTFFLLSGILAVYATIGKITKDRFLRTLHFFYINRLLRIFPLLAAAVLLQSSVFNHLSDGPYWRNVQNATELCREYWWTVLLHIQNYVNTLDICLSQTWYLSVDMQLYIICPLVMIFLFGRDKFAWGALTIFMLICLTGSSVISFTNNFSAGLGNPNRLLEFNDYISYYYLNTLSRAPPFAVGMIYGYILYVTKEKDFKISRVNVILLWLLAFGMMAFCLLTIYPVMQADHDAQMFDNFLNAYMRAIWGVALGWLILACHKGYGGPINWFLSLDMWKLPARMSYAMYLIHVPIIMVANGSWVKTYYYSDGLNIYRFMSDLGFSFIAAFILCITIDTPCALLQKIAMGGGGKRPQRPKLENDTPNGAGALNENKIEKAVS